MNKQATKLSSVEAVTSSMANGIVCLIDLARNNTLRHSYVTTHLGFIQADSRNLADFNAFVDMRKNDTRYEVTVYDLLDKTSYKLRPHEVDAKAYRIAGLTPPPKAGDQPFVAHHSYRTLPGLTFQGQSLPADCDAYCLNVADESVSFRLSLPNGARPTLTTDAKGVLHKGGKSLPVVKRSICSEGFTTETNSYLVLSEQEGPLHIPAGFRKSFDLLGTGRIEPTVEYAGDNGLIDVVLLANKISV